jgi:hypothetical protein
VSFNLTGTIRIDRSAVERLLRLPGGLVYFNMQRRTRRVEAEARRLAPGSMDRFITSEVSRNGREIAGYVTSNHPATIFVINGTKPHIIRPVRARALRFTVGGRVVFARIVHHPGTKPNDFLTAALRAAR